MEQILTVFELISIRPDLKIITIEVIYKKMKILLDELKKHQEAFGSLSIGKVYLLQVNEYFEYGGFLWLAKDCCWFEPSFDLIVVPNKAKDLMFLIESPKLTEIKYI